MEINLQNGNSILKLEIPEAALFFDASPHLVPPISDIEIGIREALSRPIARLLPKAQMMLILVTLSRSVV